MAVFTTLSICSPSSSLSADIRSQRRSSVTLTPSSSESGTSRAVSGRLAPVSHLLTALSETKSRCASSFWVQPFSRLSCATKAPKLFLSSSNIALTSSPVYIRDPARATDRK